MIHPKRLKRLTEHRKQALDQTRASLQEAEAEHRVAQASLRAAENLMEAAQRGQRELVNRDVSVTQYLQMQEWVATCEAKLYRARRDATSSQASVRSARQRVERARMELKKIESLEVRVECEMRRRRERAERREEDEWSGRMARRAAAENSTEEPGK